MPTLTPSATVERSSASRWLTLVVLCAGMLMIVLDQTVVNVALPAIRGDLGFSQAGLAWVVNAYLIPFGGLLLLAGRLGDLIGRKRVFLSGLIAFTLASLLCGLATSQEVLVIARFLQGGAGAVASAVILGVIVSMFQEPREQAKAIGVYSFVAVAGGAVGLLAGGVLTQSLNWHWIFFVNIPIGIVVAVVGTRMIEDDRGIGLREGADVAGAVLVTSAVMVGVYTIVKAENYGWASARTLGYGALALVLLAAFVARQATAAKPLLPLRVFRSRNVSGANVITALIMSGMMGMFFLATLYLQQVLGYDALEIGFAFLPVTLIVMALSLGLSARLISRFGGRLVLVSGLVLVAAGLGLLARVPVDGGYVADLLPSMALLGVGAGLMFPALMTLAMSGATPRDAGLASGLVNTMMQVGGALGLAVLATLSASRTERLLGDGKDQATALTGGYHLAFAVATGLVAVAIIVGLAVLRTPPQPKSVVAPESPAAAPSTADDAGRANGAGGADDLGGANGKVSSRAE